MADPLLTLLALIIAALALHGLLGLVWPGQSVRVLWSAAILAAIGATCALLALLSGSAPHVLRPGPGLPGAAFGLDLDPLAAFFTLWVLGAGAALCASLSATRTADAAPVPIALAGCALALMGSDGFASATGIAVAGLAIWLIQPPGRDAALQLAVALLAAAAVAAADRAPLPALPWLALLGPGALAGLLPFRTRATAARAGPTPATVLLFGAIPTVTTDLLLRMLLGAPGAVPPAWSALPVLLAAAAAVLAAVWYEGREQDLDAALAGGTTRQAGLIAIGIGMAMMARGADLPDSAGMALAAVLLLAALQAIAGTTLALAAGAIRQGAGTHALDRMGGLIHRMPLTTACLLAAMFSLAALPPSAGFAAIWLLFHAVLGLPRATGLPFRVLLCGLAAVLGLAAALNAASLLRVVGIACLGRPRNPRTAVAEEPPRAARRVLAGLALAALGWGVLTGPLLRLLAEPPARLLAQTGLGPAITWFGVAAGTESPGYASLPVSALLLLAITAALWLRRRQIMRHGVLQGPAWNDGFAAPPGWLPFGDPATQADGTGFVPAPPLASLPRLDHPLPGLHPPRQPLQALGRPRRRLQALSAPAAALLLAAILLAVCAWLGPT